MSAFVTITTLSIIWRARSVSEVFVENRVDGVVATPITELHSESPIEEIAEDPEHRRSFLGNSNRVESAEEVIEG